MADKKPRADKKADMTADKKADKKSGQKSAPKAAKKTAARKPASKPAAPSPARIDYVPREARAFQRSTRQSPYKMRLVIDQIRGLNVNDALSLLKFSKKHAALQISKVLQSAVANAEQRAREANESIDVDTLYVKKAIVNE